jgi:hypothetical protein
MMMTIILGLFYRLICGWKERPNITDANATAPLLVSLDIDEHSPSS